MDGRSGRRGTEIVLVTGSGGLVGSATCRHFAATADLVVGVDNDSRAAFFGPEASTGPEIAGLQRELENYRHVNADVRDETAIRDLLADLGSDVRLVVHTAAQPSHDWAARDPLTDFSINATATMLLLEAVRDHCPDAAFIFTSTNKVYGDRPNSLPMIELDTRWEVEPGHPYAERGIDESMSIDETRHSFLGVSKLSADVLVQEYGRYFGLKTTILRAGCLSGPSHAAAELHGFLAYLMKCAEVGRPYIVRGYKGKQVRDNLHADDLASAFREIYSAPRSGEVYNIGGGRFSNCSMLEAIELCEEITGRPVLRSYDDEPRRGDHIWWISDTTRFSSHYPAWQPTKSVPDILHDIHAARSAHSHG